MAKFDAEAADALSMIAENGVLTTFTRPGGASDPVRQSGPTGGTSYDAYAVAFPLAPGKAVQMFGSVNVQKARLDVHIALRGVSATPRAGDRFTWSSRVYAIMADPELMDPAGEGAFYAHAYAEAA